MKNDSSNTLNMLSLNSTTHISLMQVQFYEGAKENIGISAPLQLKYSKTMLGLPLHDSRLLQDCALHLQTPFKFSLVTVIIVSYKQDRISIKNTKHQLRTISFCQFYVNTQSCYCLTCLFVTALNIQKVDAERLLSYS